MLPGCKCTNCPTFEYVWGLVKGIVKQLRARVILHGIESTAIHN